MSLTISCYYCGAQKNLECGEAVKLACDRCSSPNIILHRRATFKCLLCGKSFSLPANSRVRAGHDDPTCLGRALVLIDYD